MDSEDELELGWVGYATSNKNPRLGSLANDDKGRLLCISDRVLPRRVRSV